MIHLSESLLYDIKIFKKIKNIYVLNNGIKDVNVDKYKKNNSQKTNFLFLSNLIEEKGVLIILQAAKTMIQKGYLNFQINFVGKFESKIFSDSFFSLINDNQLNDYVSYLGPKYDEEKNITLAKSDIFILPTFYKFECFPLVLLEAMQFSLPVVSTNEGAICDIVENKVNGLICNKKDHKDLANKLIYLIKNKNLQEEMSLNSRKKFLEKYTMKKFENNLSGILVKELDSN